MDRLLEATARAERDHFWFRGFRRFVTPLLDTGAAGRGDLLSLDCGCGTGHNLQLLRRYGRAVGVTVLPSREWNVYDPQVIRWRLAGADESMYCGTASYKCIACYEP